MATVWVSESPKMQKRRLGEAVRPIPSAPPGPKRHADTSGTVHRRAPGPHEAEASPALPGEAQLMRHSADRERVGLRPSLGWSHRY